MKRGKRAASLLLALTLVLSYAAVPVFAAGETGDTEKESIPQGNQTEGSWVYEVAEGAMGGPGGGGPGGPGGPGGGGGGGEPTQELSLIHISEPTRLNLRSRMPSSA